MARHVRKGDQVMVIAGNDRGKTGHVLRVDPKNDQVYVEGVNVRKRHVRPSQQNPQGGRIDKEMAIHISNVQPVTTVDGKPRGTRVRFEIKEDGSKARVAARNGEVLSTVRKARNK